MKIVHKLLFLLLVFTSTLFASQKQINEISQMSGLSLYNIDKASLQKILTPYVKEQKNILALEVVEELSKENYFLFFKDDEKLVFNQKFPEKFQNLKSQEGIITFGEDSVGRYVIYFQEDQIEFLNDKEIQWIKNNPKVKVIEFFDEPPFTLNTNKKEGYVYELLEYTLKSVNLEIEYVNGYSSYGAMLGDLENAKADILTTFPTSLDLGSESNIYKSKSVLKTPFILIGNTNSPEIKSINDIFGKRVAVVKGYMQDGYLSKFPEIKKVYVNNNDEGFKVIREGKADYYVNNRANSEYVLNKSFSTDLKIVHELSYEYFPPLSISFALNKNRTELVSIVEKALERVPFQEIQRIRSQWIISGEGEVQKSLDLNEKELAWLEKNEPISYVYDINWAPFEWKNELGEHTGIVFDILTLIEEKSGLDFVPITTNSWSEAVDLMKSDKADMYSGIGENEERKEYLKFTKKALFKTPYVFVSRIKDKNDYLETFQAIKNQKVAVVDGYTIHGLLKTKEPNLPLHLVESIDEGFKKVQNRTIDIFIVNAATAKYYINRLGYEDLKIATKTEFNLELKIALKKEMADEVVSIVDKALDAIDEKELSDIYFKWTEVLVEEKIDWELIYNIVGGALILLLGAAFWNRRLKNAVDEKTYELQKLLNSFDENVIASRSDLFGDIIYASDALSKISGYSKDELLGSPHSILRHPEMPKELFKDLWQTIQSGKTWEGEIKNRKKDGGTYWVFAIISPEYNKNGKLTGYSAIRQDITAKKEVEELSSNLEIKVEERTKELVDERKYIDSIMNSQSNLVISTDGVQLRTANRAFFTFFNVGNVEDFIANIGNCICDTFDKSNPKDYIQKDMNGQKWIEYVYDRPNQIHKAVIIRDDKKHIFSITSDRFEFAGEMLEVAVFTDITEIESIRKNIETILSNIMLPVLITSKDKREIIYANDYASKQYEASIEELVGQSIDSVYTSLGQKDEILNVMKEQGFVENLEEKYRTQKGKEFIGLLSVKPITYDRQEAYIGMVVDITKQKEIEEEIRKIHKHTQSSIEYASLIQHALIPSDNLLENYFDDYFTIWKPKDIVGGDIYLFEELRAGNECILMMIDCTGHGVPGAFVTMLVKAIERQIISTIKNNDEVVSPGKILSIFNKSMKHLLKQEGNDAISNAGFDGAIFYYNKEKSVVKFAGAELPLFYIEDGELKTIKGDRHSIGYKTSDSSYEFSEHEIVVKDGMKFYLTTDGFVDQNGGEKGFPFGKRRFKNLINEHKDSSFQEQKDVLLQELKEYQKDEERNDDISLVGIKIGK